MVYPSPESPQFLSIHSVPDLHWSLPCLVKFNIWYGIRVLVFLGFVIGCYSSLSSLFMIEVAGPCSSGVFLCMNRFDITFLVELPATK
jgi:hypothetical protein